MKKNLVKTLLIVMFIFLSFVLTGCGSFFGGEEESIIISGVTREEAPDKDGFYIVVTYANEEKLPDRFFVPNGEKGDIGETGLPGQDGENGKDGVGIKDIQMDYNSTTRVTTVTIYFTDPDMDPVVQYIPAGRTVVGVDHGIDSTTGNTLFYILYSDNTRSEPIEVQKGEPGNHLIGVDHVENEDKSVEFTFHFSETDDVVITIPAPLKGDIGIGIDSIKKIPSDTNYVIEITYTDGRTQTIEFDRPNMWSYGTSDPNEDYGIVGDYYFDIIHNNIWLKERVDEWTLVVNLDDDETEMVTVTFNLNDSIREQASLPQGYGKTVTLQKGTCFGANGTQGLPIPTRANYVFVGWYLTKVPTVVNGAFTDVVPVNESITLYAVWEPVQ